MTSSSLLLLRCFVNEFPHQVSTSSFMAWSVSRAFRVEQKSRQTPAAWPGLHVRLSNAAARSGAALRQDTDRAIAGAAASAILRQRDSVQPPASREPGQILRLVGEACGVGFTIGKNPQLSLRRANARQQLHRVEQRKLLPKMPFDCLVDPIGGEQPLIRSLRRMIAFTDQCTIALFARQLERRLEEVDLEPGAHVQALQRGGRS